MKKNFLEYLKLIFVYVLVGTIWIIGLFFLAVIYGLDKLSEWITKKLIK